MLTVIVVTIGAVALLLTTGYLLGAQRGRDVREALRRQAAVDADELARLRERVAEQRGDEEKLRVAIERVLSPLVQREQMAHDLAMLENQSGTQRNLRALLDQIAEKGNLSAVLLSDEQGLPLAASSNARDLERLGATSSLMLLLADRLARDESRTPVSLLVHDADNTMTLCRLFHCGRQRLSLTAVSRGVQLGPTALDPALVALQATLVGGSPSIGG
ncbi:MAG: hypothetical protein U0Q12_20515 [Vicinamibacterales bacterium]